MNPVPPLTPIAPHTGPRGLRLLGAAVLMSALVACGGGQSAPGKAPAESTQTVKPEDVKDAKGDKGDKETKETKEAKEAKEGSSLKLSPEEAERAGLRVETLAPQAFAGAVTVTATIHPNQDRLARIAPRVEGRVVQVTASLGARVKAGQVLAVLDSLAIGEAQSALRHAQSGQRVAQADFKRAESLIADEIIPQRDFLRAQAELEKAAAELRAVQDRLRLLGGSSHSDGAANSTFPLTSPLAGIVIQKKAIVGELASPSDALFTVADLSRVWVEANLTEDSLSRVRVGAAATVTVAAYPGERFAGRLTYVASVLDKDSRTIPARIEVDNQDGRLKPEMFATATIETQGARRQVLSVPDAAIVLLQGQPTLFVQEHGGYEARAIEPGEKLSGRTVIQSGVAAGDTVVTAGAYALKARLLKAQISDEH